MNEETSENEVLFGSDELHKRVKGLANQINQDYVDLEIDLVCLSNSALMFASDLARLVEVPLRMHLLGFTSYSDSPQSGEVRLTLDVGEPLQNRNVLIIEAMIISGRTPLYLMNLLQQRQPASLEICALGLKPKQLAVDIQVKYNLFEFDNEWVAGYGIGHGLEKTSPNLLNMSAN